MPGRNIHPPRLCCAAGEAIVHLLDVPGVIGTEHLVIGPFVDAALSVEKPFPVEKKKKLCSLALSALNLGCVM